MEFSDGHFSSGMDLPRLFRLPLMGEQIKLVKLPSKVRKSSSVSSSRKSGRRSKSLKRSSKKSKRKVRKGTSSSSRSVKNLRSRIRRTRR